MQKIIDGKLYDTETAKEIGSDSYSNRCDFNFWEETLYRKRNGEYFLHGEGGANSKYARQIEQNSWSGGERIEPLTWAEAREWAEHHMDTKSYMAEFGEITDDDSTKQINISMPTSTYEKGKRAAQQKALTFSAYLAQLIEAEN